MWRSFPYMEEVLPGFGKHLFRYSVRCVPEVFVTPARAY